MSRKLPPGLLHDLSDIKGRGLVAKLCIALLVSISVGYFASEIISHTMPEAALALVNAGVLSEAY